MIDRQSQLRFRIGIATAAAAVLGLGVAVYGLAGRADSPRRADPAAVAVTDSPPTGVGVQPPTTAAGTPATVPPTTRPEAPPPRAAPSPTPPAQRVPARARATGSLAQAWIAAGARGIDPDTTPGPTARGGSGGPAPVRIEIDAVGVAAPVDPAGTNGDDTLEVPADFSRTSYYTGRPVPGDPGPAIVIGHVDGRRGPAVFHRLRELQPGGEVRIHRSDGSVVTFVVERSKQVPKKAFPTDEVYGPTPDPTLRLITCGGSFDRSSGHYRDNTIVFLRLKG